MAGAGKQLKKMAKLQMQLSAMQKELAGKEIEVSHGGGAVTITLTLEPEIRSIAIDPDLLEEDAETVSEMVTEAVREALETAKQQTEAAMSEITAGLNLPGFP